MNSSDNFITYLGLEAGVLLGIWSGAGSCGRGQGERARGHSHFTLLARRVGEGATMRGEPH